MILDLGCKTGFWVRQDVRNTPQGVIVMNPGKGRLVDFVIKNHPDA